APRSIAPHVERAVDRHPVHPGEELAASLELGERAIRLEEDVLRDVVARARRTRDVEREREDALAVTADQGLECAGIAGLCGCHEGRRGGGFTLGVRH